MGACGTCVTYLDEKCGSFVADGTHVPYLQIVHISMDLPNEYKHVLKVGPKIK
jgi:predicted PolB exonuclease-like 3'-5' exonuclease